ncbi:MAG: ABC transporter ATP-binding protein, partial [Asticcacaulis sp.]
LDLKVAAGETVALVGESGCGKSTSALAIMGLLPDEAEVSGQALFEGQDLLKLSPRALRSLRGDAVSMVFQDSMTSLNPVLSVGTQIVETLRLHTGLTDKAAHQRAIELLQLVDIPKAAERVHEFPYQFSGGQRQRVAIAMAVACNPRLLIADEPTTALDVAIQARILELLDRLKRELNMGLLLITHDLGLVGQWADRVAIMLRGNKIEEGATVDIFNRPQQTYTRVLLGSALSLDGGKHYHNHRLAEMSVTAEIPAKAQDPVVQAPEIVRGDTPLLSLVDLH